MIINYLDLRGDIEMCIGGRKRTPKNRYEKKIHQRQCPNHNQ